MSERREDEQEESAIQLIKLCFQCSGIFNGLTLTAVEHWVIT